MNDKLKTILLWIVYVALCLCSVAVPIAEKYVQRKLTGKEENDEFNDTAYHRDYSHRRSFR